MDFLSSFSPLTKNDTSYYLVQIIYPSWVKHVSVSSNNQLNGRTSLVMGVQRCEKAASAERYCGAVCSLIPPTHPPPPSHFSSHCCSLEAGRRVRRVSMTSVCECRRTAMVLLSRGPHKRACQHAYTHAFVFLLHTSQKLH